MFTFSQANPNSNKKDIMAKSLKLLNRRSEADDNDSATDNKENSCYETKIFGGAVIRIPFKKVRVANFFVC